MQLDEILEEMDDCIRETREKFKGYEDNKALRLYVSVMNLAKTIVVKHMIAKDKNVPTNDGWIPVEERLPTMEEYQKDDGRFILDDGNRRYQGLFGIYDGKFKFSKHISGIRYELLEDKCVIAWRPLPKPYRPEERSNKKNGRWSK